MTHRRNRNIWPRTCLGRLKVELQTHQRIDAFAKAAVLRILDAVFDQGRRNQAHVATELALNFGQQAACRFVMNCIAQTIGSELAIADQSEVVMMMVMIIGAMDFFITPTSYRLLNHMISVYRL